MDFSADGIVDQEQIEVPARFLVSRQHQSLGGGVTSSAVGFDGNGLDVEEQQSPFARQMPENPADAGQDRRALRVLTDQLALNAPKAQTVFLATAASVHDPGISPHVF